jgi:hypothetical protein
MTRAEQVLDTFLSKGYPFEVAIGFAGVWGAESGINPKRYNANEKNEGGSAPSQTSKTYKSKGVVYRMDKDGMKLWGYGKGVAQWTWTRVFKFRDWYNEDASAVKTPGVSEIDTYGADILKTNMETQTAFAWYEIEKCGRTELINFVASLQTKKPSVDMNGFEENVVKSCDAVLRGFENGHSKFTTVEDIDYRHRKHGGYNGIMDRRVGWALGVFEEVKNNPKYAPYV